MNKHTAAMLERHFDTAFAAPDGIKKLRELILTLAMQGKLVPQDPSEQPASDLLQEIEAEKQRLVKEGKIKKPKPLLPVTEEEKPCSLPPGWRWVRLGNISTKLTDGSHNPPRDAGSGIPMLSSQNVANEQIDFNNPSRYVSQKDFDLENKRTAIEAGDVLLTIVASLGRSAVVPEDAPKFVLQRSVAVVRTDIVPYFLCKLFLSPICTDYYDMHAKGTAQRGIYLGKLGEMPIPLPPLVEQHRIVAKIDELMARCDELEKLRTAQQGARLTVHAAAIKQLLTIAKPDQHQRAQAFLAEHFSELYTVKENVAELRKAILQLAVMGKLVPHNPDDQPASELLKKINAVKRTLEEKEGLRTSAAPFVSQSEEVYGKPEGWSYCRLGNIGKFIDYRGKTPTKVESGVPLITAKNVRFGYVNREPKEYVTSEEYIRWMTRGFPRVGDILFTTEAPLGNIAIIDIEEKFALAQRVICLQLHMPGIATWLKNFMMSDSFQERLLLEATGMTATGIKASKLKEMPVPIPPLEEQYRIVAKVDQLMALSDSLDQQINAATTKQAELLGAVIAQV